MHEEAHEPTSVDPPGVVALGPHAVVRDNGRSETLSAEDWIARRMSAESRTRDECREALLNAIARGDVTIERSDNGDPAA